MQLIKCMPITLEEIFLYIILDNHCNPEDCQVFGMHLSQQLDTQLDLNYTTNNVT